uniref:Uncharacterized protein n=1 Tax=viral metagenome TaxID=1070528 RepID=A0A6C0IUA7_9ZZZZ
MNDTLKFMIFMGALLVLYHFLTKRCNCKKKAKKIIRQKTYFGVPGKRPPNLPVRWHI